MLNICVLRKSGEYAEQHVKWLARQVPNLHCISNVPIDGVKVIPAAHDWPIWWAKMELFRPDIEGDLMYYDLDTVVFEPLQPDYDFSVMLTDFYTPQRPGSGLMYIKQRNKAHVWETFIKNPDFYIHNRLGPLHHGDQGFLWDTLPHKRWQDLMPGSIMSYKANLRGLAPPEGCRVVCFHGQPRPWDVKAEWVPKL